MLDHITTDGKKRISSSRIDGATKTIREGGIIVQRGTNHLWRNVTSKPCRIAFILIEAPAYLHEGAPLPEHKPEDVAAGRV
ncbi:MAG: hypothetical protein ABI668_12945 [Sphingorhabdus sp.]